MAQASACEIFRQRDRLRWRDLPPTLASFGFHRDMVDFLAEREAAPPDWKPFTPDPAAAGGRFEQIIAREKVFFDSPTGFPEPVTGRCM